MTRRRSLIAAGAAAGVAGGWPLAAMGQTDGGASRAGGGKVLRVAFNSAESGFDPPQVGDATSIRSVELIFDAPLAWHPFARPARLVPRTAVALPEASEGFRRFVFTIRPGILFADHPVFGGRPRELTAADHVYAIKRLFDPRVRTEHLHHFENQKLLGLNELRAQALKSRTPFPYDVEVPGLRVLDRWRFEVRLAEPSPRLPNLFANPLITGAVAREVIEARGVDPMATPVGTGPFRLGTWRRGSHFVLERNPRFREEVFDAEADADADEASKAAAVHLRGRRLPLLDRIDCAVIEESQPRWLAFAGDEIDVLTLPAQFAPVALPGGSVAPFLARQGVRALREMSSSITHTYFNFDDPLVGGYTPEKVALRRAIALAWDTPAEIRLLLNGQAVPAQTMLPPLCYGHDPALVSAASRGDPARAAALLDVYGYRRGDDGWRRQPDGRPLVLRIAHVAGATQRQSSELWRKHLARVHLRVEFEAAPFADLINRALAGTLMMWGYTWVAGPDGDFFVGLAYGPNAGQSNDARFRLAAYDRLYERQRVLPDGPERLALLRDLQRMMIAWQPYIPHYHGISNTLIRPRVTAYAPHPHAQDFWRHADVRS